MENLKGILVLKMLHTTVCKYGAAYFSSSDLREVKLDAWTNAGRDVVDDHLIGWVDRIFDAVYNKMM